MTDPGDPFGPGQYAMPRRPPRPAAIRLEIRWRRAAPGLSPAARANADEWPAGGAPRVDGWSSGTESGDPAGRRPRRLGGRGDGDLPGRRPGVRDRPVGGERGEAARQAR